MVRAKGFIDSLTLSPGVHTWNPQTESEGQWEKALVGLQLDYKLQVKALPLPNWSSICEAQEGPDASLHVLRFINIIDLHGGQINFNMIPSQRVLGHNGQVDTQDKARFSQILT